MALSLHIDFSMEDIKISAAPVARRPRVIEEADTSENVTNGVLNTKDATLYRPGRRSPVHRSAAATKTRALCLAGCLEAVVANDRGRWAAPGSSRSGVRIHRCDRVRVC